MQLIPPRLLSARACQQGVIAAVSNKLFNRVAEGISRQHLYCGHLGGRRYDAAELERFGWRNDPFTTNITSVLDSATDQR